MPPSRPQPPDGISMNRKLIFATDALGQQPGDPTWSPGGWTRLRKEIGLSYVRLHDLPPLRSDRAFDRWASTFAPSDQPAFGHARTSTYATTSTRGFVPESHDAGTQTDHLDALLGSDPLGDDQRSVGH